MSANKWVLGGGVKGREGERAAGRERERERRGHGGGRRCRPRALARPGGRGNPLGWDWNLLGKSDVQRRRHSRLSVFLADDTTVELLLRGKYQV